MLERRIFSTMCVALAFACTACSVSIPIDTTLDEPSLVEQIPITVGVQYTDDLTTKEWVRQELFGTPPFHRWDLQFQLGPATVALFDQVTTSMFEGVKRIKSSSSGSLQKLGIDALLHIRINDFNINFWDGVYVAEIEYEIRFYATQRETPRKWNVVGHGRREGMALPPVYSSGTSSLRSISVMLAMRNSAASFMREFYTDDDVRNWLTSKGLDLSKPGTK